MWILLAFGSALFAGLTAILAKCGIRDTDSTLATALRTVVVLIFSWIMVFVVGSQGQFWGIRTIDWLFLTLSGIATGASWLCYFKALQTGPINKVTPIDKSSTILTMLLAFIFLGEPITLIKAVALVLIGVGTVLMIQKQPGTQEAKGRTWLLYAAGAAVFAALTSILGKIGMSQLDSTLGTAIRTGVVLVMAWVMVFVTGKQSQIKSVSVKSWVFLALSGIATGSSWLCYFKALQMGPASVVVPIDKLSITKTRNRKLLFSVLSYCLLP